MKRVYVFDFDGTLTIRDTFVAFIRYVFGIRKTLCGLFLYLPQLLLMKLGLYPNWKVKQRVFAHFFRGMTPGRFDGYCRAFANTHAHLLRPEGIKEVQRVLSLDVDVIIVTASVENWVRPFFSGVACKHDGISKAVIVGTKVEDKDGRLTGRFLTENCYGQEKVRRLTAIFPNRSDYRLVAYGDSHGDKEMLAYADEAHYKPFRQ